METSFTENIKKIIKRYCGEYADAVFERSMLLEYINKKTRSANKGAKSRSSFSNLYAIYVILEDYIEKEFHRKGDYSKYEGAPFNKLFTRQRELPFGSKLQNHSLNNRLNAEFQKYFPTTPYIPILRNLETNRYWINENLLHIDANFTFNIAPIIIEIIDEYIKVKQDSFERFVKSCQELKKISKKTPAKVIIFIADLLAPNVDARLFEIVSYAILKYHYYEQYIIWGFEMNHLTTENLKLYKTGRTNANDGGIDFVMKPLGKFFQVTETLDFKKYFLDIDKIQKFPITFIIKSEENTIDISNKIRENANKTYSIDAIVDRYMNCIEEIINIPILKECFENAVLNGHLNHILDEIIIQSKVEFNQ